MALADIPNNGQARRFDSWKEIADYLGRDVRTAIRWESQGLPVHRIPGGKGTSVFALSSEIDAWMSGRQSETTPEILLPPAVPLRSRPRISARVGVIAVVLLLALSLSAMAFVLRGAASATNIASLHVTATSTDISLAGDSGVSRVIYRFQPDRAVLIDRAAARVTDLNGDGEADIVAGICFYSDPDLHTVRGGEVLALSPHGDVHWRFALDDVLTFPDGKVRGPWAVAAWEPSGGTEPTRIAVAAHDYLWWASMVTIIDNGGHRQQTFVNPGWIESLLWLGSGRLALGGFNNSRNEAMVALIDPDLDGQAPGSAGTSFWCASCSANAPLFYATMARSEVNLATASPFNRASVALVGDRIIVTTSEAGSSPATAIYEFDRDLTLLRARYSEAYWEMHDQLHREGRLSHSRADCPERDGPPPIHVWDAATSRWQTRAR